MVSPHLNSPAHSYDSATKVHLRIHLPVIERIQDPLRNLVQPHTYTATT